MHTVEIAVDEPYTADSALIERAVLATLAAEGVTEPCELSVLVTSDAELHRLNRDFRGVDAATDVLSFGDQSDQDGPVFVRPPDTPRYLGDLAISAERVAAQAAEYGHAPARELAFLTVHGTLHLLGYDHELSAEDDAAMRSRQDAVMNELGLTR